jgi:hypothetical protein
MKIDLAGPARRGLAMGINEFAGYGALALSALATGYVASAYGLRPEPFYLGVGYVAVGLGSRSSCATRMATPTRKRSTMRPARERCHSANCSCGRRSPIRIFRRSPRQDW